MLLFAAPTGLVSERTHNRLRRLIIVRVSLATSLFVRIVLHRYLDSIILHHQHFLAHFIQLFCRVNVVLLDAVVVGYGFASGAIIRRVESLAKHGFAATQLASNVLRFNQCLF